MADTVTCRFCKRSRPRRMMEESERVYGWQCKDEVGCSEATQWSPGEDDGR
jgi:hypothetical protein